MNALVPITLFGWPLVHLLLFALIRHPRRAVLAGVVLGTLFLPMWGYDFPAITYWKLTAVALSSLLGVAIYDFPRLMSFRMRWIDVPVFLSLFVPMGTSLSNDLGVYEGTVGIVGRFVGFAVLYVLGRLYFVDWDSLRDALMAVVIGALVYVPLCAVEVILSPQLHRWVYGYHQHSFAQTIRHGGFRPTVFMQHGLAVASWMMAGTVAAFVWMRTRRNRSDLIPLAAFVTLGLTVVAIKSTNTWIMTPVGLFVLWMCVKFRARWILVGLCCLPAAYVTARISGVASAEHVREVAELIAPADRVGSLDARLRQEDAFGRHTASRLWWGWGGWMRNFPTDENGRRLTRGVDSLWVITYSQNGLIGIVLLLACQTGTAILCAWRYGGESWTRPGIGTVCGISAILALYTIDCLANAMPNGVFILLMGALGSIGLMRLAPRPAAAMRPAARASSIPVAVTSSVGVATGDGRFGGRSR